MTRESINYFRDLEINGDPEFRGGARAVRRAIQDLVRANHLPQSYGKPVETYETGGVRDVNGYKLHVDDCKLEVEGNNILLGRIHTKVLEVLMLRPMKVVSRREIALNVYGSDEINERTIDTNVCHLRNKVRKQAPSIKACPIESVRFAGYRFVGLVLPGASFDIA